MAGIVAARAFWLLNLVRARRRIGAMKPMHLYLSLGVAGTVIPCAPFVSWLGAHGLNLRLFVQEIPANRISVLVVVVFRGVERQCMKLRFRWTLLPVLLLVGVSLALPLYSRESALDESRPHALASGGE